MLICHQYSLEVNILLGLAHVSHEWGSPHGIEDAFIIDVVVLPGLWEFGAHELIEVSTLLAEMGFDNFFGENFSLILSDEELSIWSSLLGYTLGSVVFDNVSSEEINLMFIRILEIAWENSVVRILPLSIIVVVSYESVESSLEAAESLAELLNSSLLCKVLSAGVYERSVVITAAVAVTIAARVRVAFVAEANQALLSLFELGKSGVGTVDHLVQIHLDGSS